MKEPYEFLYDYPSLSFQQALPESCLYCFANLNSRRVADYFGRTERTLRNHFKATFNITIRDYYTSCRLRQALLLMKSKNLPVSDVFYQVGYNDESTFRYEMKRYKYGWHKQQIRVSKYFQRRLKNNKVKNWKG